jgi:hypothetical protein
LTKFYVQLKFLRILECLNYLNLIQMNTKEKKQGELFPFEPPLAVPKPARLVAHLKSRVLASTHGTQGGAGDCPVAPATPATRTSG